MHPIMRDTLVQSKRSVSLPAGTGRSVRRSSPKKKAPAANYQGYNYKLYTQTPQEFSQESVRFFTIQKGINGIDLTLIFVIGAYFKLTVVIFNMVYIFL